MKHLSIFLILAFFLSCETKSSKDSVAVVETALESSEPKGKLPLDLIKLPPGFKIELYAEVPDARSMALSPSGVLYVGNRDKDKVYAVKDSDKDGKADQQFVLASGLNMPNGVAFKDGNLYIAEVNRISVLKNIEASLANPPKLTVINDTYPKDAHHGWKYIAFGPDGKLYIPVGAPCNICESKDQIYASLTRINADGSGREIIASGIRNTVGFTWHPDSKELFFTDNGRDNLGDDKPSCELNKLTTVGQHFGYPYCHEGTIADAEFGSKRKCSEFVPPFAKMGAHVAPLGLKFYTGNQFPAEYKNKIFVALHGSWNRTKKSGYNLTLVDENGKTSVFASGWLNNATQEVWGRPVDVLVNPDGSMFVSDDQAGVIYRITYSK